ncbi:hypothetical protein [Caulobacter phage Cr30]|uniref:hypothetical protein n=1 Tax=Caulobacter phage Cr30 TaxID=1357714 RepID=UPI0004A9B611|nr:hypothetical protein OZ74_gp020 [Caulobacter phage Cr30]AGS80905.1 hypothetical protein [Caulobacter phage Cr30]
MTMDAQRKFDAEMIEEICAAIARDVFPLCKFSVRRKQELVRNLFSPPPSAPVEAVAWNAGYPQEVWPEANPTPEAVERLVEAAKEGLICAEADLETQRQQCLEDGENPEDDQFYKVFKARRDLISEALATFQEVGR